MGMSHSEHRPSASGCAPHNEAAEQNLTSPGAEGESHSSEGHTHGLSGSSHTHPQADRRRGDSGRVREQEGYSHESKGGEQGHAEHAHESKEDTQERAGHTHESREDEQGQSGHTHGKGGHSHSHAHTSRGRLAAALAVTATILLVELVSAFFSGSLSLAADAGHMAVDSSGLVIALFAAHLMSRPRDDRHTWGWARSEVLAAALQAGMLMVICAVIAWEGVERLLHPRSVDPLLMAIVGTVGLVANGLSLLILLGGRHDSLNMRAAFLEVLTDALGSVAVIAAAGIAWMTGWSGADAVASLIIACFMAPRSLVLMRSSIGVLMERVPEELDLSEVRTHIAQIPGVTGIHDLHVSTVSSGLVSLTAHVMVTPTMTSPERDSLVHSLGECAQRHFPVTIDHATFQIESEDHAAHEHLRH